MAEYYRVGLVGEQYYKKNTARCRVGDIVDVCVEIGNPHDENAIVVRNRYGNGGTIGYIARDSFVQRVIHQDKAAVTASVLKVYLGKRGFYEIVIFVAISDGPPKQVQYRIGESEAWTPPVAVSAPPPDSTQRPRGLSFGTWIAFAIIVFVLVRCVS